MCKTNSNIPEIRFPGFTDPWEQRKVKDVCSISTGKSNTQDKVDDGEYPFYVRSPIIEHSNKFLFDEEAVLTVGDGVGTGKVFHYVNGKYDLHQRVYRLFGFSEDTDAKFFYHWFSSHFYDRVMSMTAKTSVDSVRLEMISDMDFIAPSVDEQRRIASSLGYLDNIITLHQRKCDELKTFKKGLLQQMFPQPGEAFPRVRFPGFTDPWEQRKLGEILDDMYNGQTPSRANPNYWNGKIKWLSSGELNRGLITQCSESITEEGQKSANLRVVPKGTFVMAITGLEAAGTRGNCGILGFDTTMNQSCMALFPNKRMLCPEFLFQWYKMIGEEYGIRFTQGTKQQSYNAEIIKELAICLPKIEEQTQLTELLFSLDNLITLHLCKCDELKIYKKGLLQHMFI